MCRRMGVFCAAATTSTAAQNCKIDGDCASGSCVGSYDPAGVLSGSKKCVSCYNNVKDGTESDTEYVSCGCSCCCCCGVVVVVRCTLTIFLLYFVPQLRW